MNRVSPLLTSSLIVVAAVTLGACSATGSNSNSADGSPSPADDVAQCGGYNVPEQNLWVTNNTSTTLVYSGCHAYQTTAWWRGTIDPGQTVLMGFIGDQSTQGGFHKDDAMDITFDVNDDPNDQRVMHFHASTDAGNPIEMWMDNDTGPQRLRFSYGQEPAPTFTIQP